jgi:hypothetical protein
VRADVRIAQRESRHVIVAALERHLDRYARVDTEIHEIAVAKRPHHAREHGHRLRTVGARAPHHLVGPGVDAVVAPLARYRPRARNAVKARSRIGDTVAVVPESEFVGAGQTTLFGIRIIVRRLIDGVLDFADHERAIAQREIRAACIELLRIALTRRRIAIEYAAEHGDGFGGFGAHTHAERRKRISRPACRQIDGRQDRPAERRVHERAGILAGHEFLVQALQTDLRVDLIAGKRLLIPHTPATQSRANRRRFTPSPLTRLRRVSALQYGLVLTASLSVARLEVRCR